MAEASVERDPASYRDPAGFVFRRDGVLLRQVNEVFAADWRLFEHSGLSAALRQKRILVDHESIGVDAAAIPGAADVIRPEPIPFLSFPYEWSFSQLKDAALLTLQAQELALAHGMTLKDASAFNVQFMGSAPVLIDSLSFERYEEGRPWVAYRQFCQHFLGPLAAMSYRGPWIALLLRDVADGIPVEIAADLLPARSKLRWGLLSHLHLHAAVGRRAARASRPMGAGEGRRVTRLQLRALIDSLRRTVESLTWKPRTQWSEYGRTTSYTAEAAEAKRRIVADMLTAAGGAWAWDIGANTGDFSELAAEGGRSVVAIDADPGASELHYRRLRQAGSHSTLAIVGDLRVPSPSLGWGLRERPSLLDRANADVVLALAVVHHLALGGNVQLAQIAAMLARLGKHAIVEFVDRGDPQVRQMLSHRRDVFGDYSLDSFRAALDERFTVRSVELIPGTAGRTLFALERRRGADS